MTRHFKLIAVLLYSALALSGGGFAQDQGDWELVVCADPNSMPFSHRDGTGVENEIARILADDLGAELSFVWWPQNQTMIDLQLRTGNCDVIIGVLDGAGGLLDTVAYYRSPHVFVYPADAGFTIESLDDPVLADLRIGVQANNTPPHAALLARDLQGAVVLTGIDAGFSAENYLGYTVQALEEGEIDVAMVWGPVGAYFADVLDTEMVVQPITPEIEPPFLSQVSTMAMGVRAGDEELRDLLNISIVRQWDTIQQVMTDYGIPLSALPQPTLPAEVQLEQVNVGVVLPLPTGNAWIEGAEYELAAQAAQEGAIMASDALGNELRDEGYFLRMAQATAPNAESARRALRRMAATLDVTAVLGGIGADQGALLAEAAETTGVPFVNIGSGLNELRDAACYRMTINVAPSNQMYGQALVDWLGTEESGWYVIHDGSSAGHDIETDFNHLAGVLTGVSVVTASQPVYYSELAAAAASGASALLVAVSAMDEPALLAQIDSSAFEGNVYILPDMVSQGREFLSAAGWRAGEAAAGARVAAWEATLENEALPFNERYMGRWGRPADPSAWTAWAGMKLLVGAVSEAGTDAQALMTAILQDPTRAEIGKDGVAFDAATQQLMQSLVSIELDVDADWGLVLSRQLAVARAGAFSQVLTQTPANPGNCE